MVKQFSNLWKDSISFAVLPCCVYLFISLGLTHTPPHHKSTCHRGNITLHTEPVYKKDGFIFSPVSPGYLTSMSWQLCIWRAFLRHQGYLKCCSHRPRPSKNPYVFCQLQAMTPIFIFGDKWWRYPCVPVVKPVGQMLHRNFGCRISDPYL